MSDSFAYIGVKDGSVRAICFDDPEFTKETAKLVADWIKMGRQVERVSRHVGLERMMREHEERKSHVVTTQD